MSQEPFSFYADACARRPTKVHSLLLVRAAHSVITPRKRPLSRAARRPADPVAQLKKRYGLNSRAFREFSVRPPMCSVAVGASGIAYALARTADLSGESDLLLAADAWIAAAEERISSKHAFLSPKDGTERRAIGFASLAFAEPGLFYLKAIIRSQMRDAAGADAAVRQFLKFAKTHLSRIADLHLGGLGLALAANHLTGCISSTRLRSDLSNFGRRILRRAWAKTGTGIRRNQVLGFAHGLAGQVFAAFACGEPQLASRMLDQLREAAIPHRKAIIWPLRSGSSRFWLGWCNGLAGHLLMWTTVWQHSHSNDDRELLDRLAWTVWKYRMAFGSLCCGAAGQAAILAVFSSRTGEHHWKPEILKWLNSFRPRWTAGGPPQSLFHGRLGLLLARIECEYGAPPQFPLYHYEPALLKN